MASWGAKSLLAGDAAAPTIQTIAPVRSFRSWADARPRRNDPPCAEMADRPIAELPNAITLTRDEAAIVFFALDIVDSGLRTQEGLEGAARGSLAHTQALAGAREPSRQRGW